MAKKVDPMFYIPEGLDWEYTTATQSQRRGKLPLPAMVNVIRMDSNINDNDDSAPQDGNVAPPQSIEVISQTVRISSDGTQVVDVVLGITDYQEAPEYNLRVNKV